MREKLEKRFDEARIETGRYGTPKGSGLMGAFYFQSPVCKEILLVLSSGPDNGEWEHVSVSLSNKNRTPNWPEMCFVKDIFWDKEEYAVQFHPPESEYVNNHPYTLHLWKPKGFNVPLPPRECV